MVPEHRAEGVALQWRDHGVEEERGGARRHARGVTLGRVRLRRRERRRCGLAVPRPAAGPRLRTLRLRLGLGPPATVHEE